MKAGRLERLNSIAGIRGFLRATYRKGETWERSLGAWRCHWAS
jgi:hypothetical protein